MGIFSNVRAYASSGDCMETELKELHMRERPVRKLDKKEKDYLMRVIAVQLILATILTGVLFFMKKSDSDSYQQLRSIYAELSKQDMTPGEIVSAFKTMSGFVFLPASEWGEPTTEVNTEQEEETLTGAGGADIKLAEDNTSFAPFCLTQPMYMPLCGKVTSKFGYRINPISQEYGFHTGIDIAAPHGTDICAALGGKVKEASFSNGRGNYIVIEHSEDLETVYCHCSEILTEVGTVLRGGEVIAKVGSTGMSTGPHLHFEIRIGGVWCNPAHILKL